MYKILKHTIPTTSPIIVTYHSGNTCFYDKGVCYIDPTHMNSPKSQSNTLSKEDIKLCGWVV